MGGSLDVPVQYRSCALRRIVRRRVQIHLKNGMRHMSCGIQTLLSFSFVFFLFLKF